MRDTGKFGMCRESVHDSGDSRSVGFHPCGNKAISKAGFCGTHDPKKIAERKSRQMTCAYVYPNDMLGRKGQRCDTRVHKRKYCSWHAESVGRERTAAKVAKYDMIVKFLKRGVKSEVFREGKSWHYSVNLLKKLKINLLNT